jgi:hypothetical protein
MFRRHHSAGGAQAHPRWPADPLAASTGRRIALAHAVSWLCGGWLNLQYGRAVTDGAAAPWAWSAMVGLIAWVSYLSGQAVPRRRVMRGGPWRVAPARRLAPGRWWLALHDNVAAALVAVATGALAAAALHLAGRAHETVTGLCGAALAAGIAARLGAAVSSYFLMHSEDAGPPLHVRRYVADRQAGPMAALYGLIAAFYATFPAMAAGGVPAPRLARGIAWTALVVGLVLAPLVRLRVRLDRDAPGRPRAAPAAAVAPPLRWRAWFALPLAALVWGATRGLLDAAGVAVVPPLASVLARGAAGALVAALVTAWVARVTLGERPR